MPTLTNAQISAGAAILCDCPRPKPIGRNTAISVYEAMHPAPAASTIPGWRERIGKDEHYQLTCPTQVEQALQTENADLRAALADTDANAPWLTLAHIICADAGIAPGHITARLQALRDVLDADEIIDAARASKPGTSHDR